MKNALVFQTDFGLADGAVSAMYGVAHKVDSELKIFNLTHDIPQYNIWEASYRLIQTIMYWAEGTVFVSVVDPGVGTDRKSVVVKTATGQYIVTPDNGTLTHVKRMCGIVEAREIDENIKGFKGHIIVDHGTYSWIEKDIEKNTLKAINNINIESIPNLDKSPR